MKIVARTQNQISSQATQTLHGKKRVVQIYIQLNGNQFNWMEIWVAFFQFILRSVSCPFKPQIHEQIVSFKMADRDSKDKWTGVHIHTDYH